MFNFNEFFSTTYGITLDAGETAQEFLNRAVIFISNLDEAGWEQLPEAVQVWYNEAADVLSQGEEGAVIELPLPPGFNFVETQDTISNLAEESDGASTDPNGEEGVVKDQEVDKEETSGEEVTEEAAKPKQRGRKPKDPNAPKVERKPKEPKEPKEPAEPRGPIAADAVRQALCNNITLSIDDVLKLLEEQGIQMKRSSCQVVHLNTVRAFQTAVQLGQVKDDGGTVILTASK